MYKCDICGKEVNDKLTLYSIVEEYRFNDIKDLCDSCNKEVNEYIYKINMAFTKIFAEKKTTWIKKLMRKKKEKIISTNIRDWAPNQEKIRKALAKLEIIKTRYTPWGTEYKEIQEVLDIVKSVISKENKNE